MMWIFATAVFLVLVFFFYRHPQTTLKVIGTAIAIPLGVLILIVITDNYDQQTTTTIDSRSQATGNWIRLQTGRVSETGVQLSNVSYSTQAIFESDISLPKITNVSGEAKFIRQPDTASLALGYVVKVSVDALDMSKVPEKYKKERPTTIAGETWNIEPIEKVVYAIFPSFSLRDADDFELAKIKGDKHFLYSGTENRFQSIVSDHVPDDTAGRVSSIKLTVEVEECETCNGR